MGCGLGYLTFALHCYLLKSYPNVITYGIDSRSKLIDDTNKISEELGYDNLIFKKGYIGDKNFADNEIDIVIALHACDTATDDAIWEGIQSNAKIIVVAPCCQKQITSMRLPNQL